MNQTRKKTTSDIVLLVVLTLSAYILANNVDLLERVYIFSRAHEAWEIDELWATGAVISLLLVWFSWRRCEELLKTERFLQQQKRQLEHALKEVQLLRGILPICSHCKSIRDDDGYWHRVEYYIEEHTDARFTHGICPECLKENFPEQILEQHKTS